MILYPTIIVIYCIVAFGHLLFISEIFKDKMQFLDVIACVFFPILWIYLIIIMLKK